MKITYIEIARQIETPAPYTPDMTTTVGKLRHLRHVVERIDPQRFDMETIMGESDCGAAGCMLGWAGLDSHFRSIGICTSACGLVVVDGYLRPAYSPFVGKNLGIKSIEANRLFTQIAYDNESYPLTIAHGIARIDRMIEKYSA